MTEPEHLRQAIEASMQDIGLGTEERLDRAEARIRAAIEAEAQVARAALAAPVPPGLDVERLARAMTNVGVVRGDSHFDADLASVAAEYARLEGVK